MLSEGLLQPHFYFLRHLTTARQGQLHARPKTHGLWWYSRGIVSDLGGVGGVEGWGLWQWVLRYDLDDLVAVRLHVRRHLQPHELMS